MISIDWSVFLQPALLEDVPWVVYILKGLYWTLGLSVCSFALAMVAGVFIGTLSTLPNHPWLERFCSAWVELFRNIPLIVQMFLWFFVIPEFVPPLKAWMVSGDPIWGQFLAAFLCLGLFTSSRIAVQTRSGIASLPRGLKNAALAIGFTTPQAYRYVILPLALRTVLPPITSEAMNLIKNTSVALTIGLSEITMRAHEMGETTYQFFAAFLLATVLYFIIALSVNGCMRIVEKHTAIPGLLTSTHR